MSITAREQPIQGFLQSLFAQADLSVSISPSVTGNVSGVFEGSAADVFRDVARSFDLVTYYDGVVVHIYLSSEITTRVFPVTPNVGARVLDMIATMELEDRHNRVRMSGDQVLAATGTRRFIEQVEEFVHAQTIATGAEPPYEFRVFYLRYAWADDVTLSFPEREVRIPGVATMLRTMMAREDGGYERIAAPASVLRPVTGMRERADGEARFMESAAGTEAGQAPEAVPAETGDVLRLAGERSVRIVADPRLNAVIVRDVRERMSTYADLIEALDVEPQLLQIEATIIDIDTNRLRELGVNWRWSHGRDEILFGRGDESDLRLRPAGDITPSGQGMFLSGVLGDVNTFTARINALERRGVARIVSSPQVLTLSNLEAVFDNTRTFFVRVAGERDVDLFDITSGTSLRVVPHVSRENGHTRIRLLVTIQDGAISDAEVDNIPVIERSAISTQALIAEGESLLIGGMTVESDTDTRSQVPILGDVPVVGALFRNTERRRGRHERLFLISPRLASPGHILNDAPPPQTGALGLDAPLPLARPFDAPLGGPPQGSQP